MTGLKTYYEMTQAELEASKMIREIELLDEQIEFKAAEAGLKLRELAITVSQAGEAGVFTFYDEVYYDSVLQCIRQLSGWSNRFPECPLTLVFDSPGGSIIDGLHLYDFLLSLRAKGHHLTTVGSGMAASMGGVLLQAGDERVMTPNAVMLIHEASSRLGGKVANMEEALSFTKKLQSKVVGILAERSRLSVRQVETRWKKTDWWLDSAEALADGFVDCVRVQ